MDVITPGMLMKGRSRVVLEAWALDDTGTGFLPPYEAEFHFEYRGFEEVIANYIGERGGALVTAMRFNIQGIDETDRKVLGTWQRGQGYVEAIS